MTSVTARTRILKGAESLTKYTWGSGTAQHFFCRTCGIYTHHPRCSDPAETGVNLGCFEDILPQNFEPIPTTDGINDL